MSFNLRGGMVRPLPTYPAVRQGLLYREEFLNALASVFSVVGTGANTTNTIGGTATRPGILRQAVTALNDVAASSQIGLVALLAGGAGNPLYVELATRIPTLSDGVNDLQCRDGLGDSTTAADHTDGIYFEQDLLNAGDQIWRGCTASNGVRTKTNLGVAAVANTYNRLRADVAADGSMVTFSVDGIPRAQNTTNIPTAAARQFGCAVLATKTLGAGLLTREVDYIEVGQTFSVLR